MKWFLKYVRNEKKSLSLVLILGLAVVLLDLGIPYLIKIIIDDVIVGKKIEIFIYVILALLGIALLKIVFGYLSRMISFKSGSSIIKSLRRDVFMHLQKLPVEYYDKTNSGELMSRIKEDTESIQDLITFGYRLTFDQMLNFILSAVVIFIINYKIALLIIAFTPILAYIAWKYEKKFCAVYEKISDQRARLNMIAQEGLSGIRVVKSLTKEEFEGERFNKESRKTFALNMELTKEVSIYDPALEFVSNIVVMAVIIFGGILVINKEMTIGALVACATYVFSVIWPMKLMGWLASVIGQATASINKMKSIFEVSPGVEDENATNIKSYDIKFENVGFNYNDKEILHDINLEIREAETLAIMGASGAGKTSLVNLINKTYEATTGKVFIGENDINHISLKDLRENISIVSQDNFLFSASIKDNIELGMKSHGEEELDTSVKISKVDEFLDSLDDGINTVVGERGLGLSGGQKQRVSIARGIVRPVKILIFDDSTSALDTHTEYDIQKNLESIKNVTKIIIAHRISAIKSADKIAIMKDGTITEYGTHEELLELGGHYYDTYMEQYQGLLDIKEEVIKSE